jgi:uncharacterized protein YbaP (TraB family)
MTMFVSRVARVLLVVATAGVILLDASPSALAQQATTPQQPEGWSIETVTVTAQAKGPAFWHARKGHGDVWILGIVVPVPKGYQWNTDRLSKLLDGSSHVLLPPRAEAGIFQAAWFLLTKRSLLSLPDGETLDGVLGPDLAARFAAARTTVHRDADRYESDAPAVAAIRLEGDFLKAYDMTAEEPADTVESVARKQGAEVRTIATYDAMGSIEAVLQLPPATSRKCVEAAINDVEFGAKHAAVAADAWAIGDIGGIKINYSEPKVYSCLLEISPLVSALDKRAIDDTVSAIETSLGSGDRTLVVAGIGQLLRKNGILDRLIADGIAVEGPPE